VAFSERACSNFEKINFIHSAPEQSFNAATNGKKASDMLYALGGYS
jgi:hypothetical protein